jgi:hypothetical protein
MNMGVDIVRVRMKPVRRLRALLRQPMARPVRCEGVAALLRAEMPVRTL